MKKTILQVVLLLLLAAHAIGQITINNADMPSVNDTIRTSISVDFMNFDFTETGEDYLWDYAGLIPFAQNLNVFINVTQTPLIYWPFFLGSANLVLKSDNFSDFPLLPVGESFQFFNKTASLYSNVGAGVEINEIPLPLKFDNPDVLYRFPLGYGDTDEGESNLEFNLPDVGYLLVERERFTEVDGWGTLLTPFGEFATLRVKSIVNEYDSIYIDSLGQGFGLYRSYIEYKWLGQAKGIPLLQVVMDDIAGATIVYQDSLRDLNVYLPEIKIRSSDQLHVYPNPASSVINIDFVDALPNTRLKLLLINASGQMIYDEHFRVSAGHKTHRINLDKRILPGTYFLIVYGDDFSFAKKIMIHN
jgi:hypothetical protein